MPKIDSTDFHLIVIINSLGSIVVSGTVRPGPRSTGQCSQSMQ